MLLKIYLKEIKDCFRDRRTLFLTVLLPVIMMTGLTFFYEKLVSDGKGQTYKLAVQQSFTNEEAAIFSEMKNIKLVKSSNPETLLKDGKADGALLLDRHFMKNIESGKKASITIIGDSFSQDSSNLMNLVQTALTVYEKTVIAKHLQANGTDSNLVQPFSVTQKEISDKNPNINIIAFLIPLILSIAIGVGSSPAASELFAGEKERKTMEALLMTPVKRSTLLFSKWLTISTVGAVIGTITLIVVAMEISLLTENLKKAVSFGDNLYPIVGFSIVISVIYAMFTASLLMLASIIGKTVKEAQSYSTPVMMLAIFPSMILVSKGINELSVLDFALPLMNLFSVLKELTFGVLNYEHIFITICSNLICMAVIFIIGRILFLKDKWVIN